MSHMFEFTNYMIHLIWCQPGPFNFIDDTTVLCYFINECCHLYGQYSYPYWDPLHQLFWGENGAVMWVLDGQIVANFIDLCIRIGYVSHVASHRLHAMDCDSLL